LSREQQKEDATRTEWLEKQGFKVIRFANDEVLNKIDDVIKTIETNI
jgi:very-short-patch-repair endonuclease